jgi:hypothetical protein
MGLGMGEVIVILFSSFGMASPILFWAPGLVELIVILFLLFGVFGGIFAAFYFLAKNLTTIGGKACPHCAEKIKADAKVCRYCHLDVTGVQVETNTSRGLFK